MSVFSTFMLVGALGKFGSEVKMFEELTDTFLKEYYKETAFGLF